MDHAAETLKVLAIGLDSILAITCNFWEWGLISSAVNKLP